MSNKRPPPPPRPPLPFLGPVHTYPDIFESAIFSFRIRLPSTRIRRIRQRIRIFLNPHSKAEKNKFATNPITCGRWNPNIFESDDVQNRSSSVSYRAINQFARSMAHALKTFYCRGTPSSFPEPTIFWSAVGS